MGLDGPSRRNQDKVAGYPLIRSASGACQAGPHWGLLAMPIVKQDVLNALDDPVLKRFKFTVGNLTVSPQGYMDVRQAVSDEKTSRFSRAQRRSPFTTGNSTRSLPRLEVRRSTWRDRAQLLHECTHAIFDAYGWAANRREDEVAAYLAQLTFMSIANPTPIAHHLGPTGKPFADLLFGVLAVIEKYSLHQPRGFGAMINPIDTETLKRLVVQLPDYAKISSTETSKHPGVPSTHNQMEGLRRAMRGAKRPDARYINVYTPSRRIDIF